MGVWLPTIVADMGVKSASAALGGFGLVLSVQVSNYPVAALAALTLATFGVMSASPLFWSFPTTILIGAAAAAGIAIINSANLGVFVIPFLVGSIKDATGSTANGIYFMRRCCSGARRWRSSRDLRIDADGARPALLAAARAGRDHRAAVQFPLS